MHFLGARRRLRLVQIQGASLKNSRFLRFFVYRNCPHYRTSLDLVAIKFKCCQTYYGCYYCHLENAGHEAQLWEASEFHAKAILCCSCQSELTIHEYLTCSSRCVNCDAEFNPKCKGHWNLYFKIKGSR
jgi:uncharacterized CHY-type Zn-finger protein